MALNGNFISFQSIIESVYRRAGYQSIDWGEAVEVVAETIRLVGVLPAYRDYITNGQNGLNPLEVVDYRVAIPSDFVALRAVRKVNVQEVPGDEGNELRITSFSPMVEATDLFYKSIREQWATNIPAGSYNYTEFTQIETLTLSGTSGSVTIVCGTLSHSLSFTTDLSTTASAFVTANSAAYLAKNIILTSDGENIIFTSNQSGLYFSQPTVTNTSGDLTGVVEGTVQDAPVIVYNQEYRVNPEYQWEYKINDGYIHCNFETGFLEVSYVGFVTDVHGFPMIPDDQRFIEAVRWSLIEHIDYKKWRVGEITDKVYQYSDQQRSWYIASARNKADIPSIDQMESIKRMFLRSIPKIDEHGTYFKYSNVQEQRYTQNDKRYSSIPFRKSY